MILIVISSASSPTVALAFQEVFVHVTELLFPPQGLLGSSTVAQEGHGEQRLMWQMHSLGSQAEDSSSSKEEKHNGNVECGWAGLQRGQEVHPGLFPKGSGRGWAWLLKISVT